MTRRPIGLLMGAAVVGLSGFNKCRHTARIVKELRMPAPLLCGYPLPHHKLLAGILLFRPSTLLSS